MTKKIPIVLFLSLCMATSFASYIRSSDIFFAQDSSNANKLNFTIIITGLMTVPLQNDSIYIKFSNLGSGYSVPLIDTSRISSGLYYKTYRVTYELSPLDTGIITVFAIATKRETYIYNINGGSSDFLPICVNASFNADSLKAYAGYGSAKFNAPPFVYDSTYKIITYNPMLSFFDNDSLSVELIKPLQNNDIEVPQYQQPNDIGSNIGSTLSVNPTTGFFVWNYPTYGGVYCIAYKVSCYRNGVFVSSVMRDMLLYILNRTSTGIDEPIDDSFLYLYPNPATSQLSCKVSTANGQYSIYTIQGSIVTPATTIPGTNFNVDVSTLPSGIYYIAIQDDKKRYVKKFVKQ